jgi:replicative DNA helicase
VNALSNPESEKVVLGLCLQDAERLYEATSGIKPEDFSLDSHRKIFSCMADMAATGKSVDYMTVANELGSKRELGSIGGAAYLSSLTEGCVGSLSYHLRVLRDKARRRLLVTACNRGLSAAEDITAETTACISAVEEALLQIEAESGGKNDFHISEFLPDVLEQLQAKAAGNDHYGFSTGIADLDHTPGIVEARRVGCCWRAAISREDSNLAANSWGQRDQQYSSQRLLARDDQEPDWKPAPSCTLNHLSKSNPPA